MAFVYYTQKISTQAQKFFKALQNPLNSMFSYLDQDRVLKKYCSNFQRLQEYFFVIIKALSSERDNSNVQIKTFPKRF